MALNRLDLNLLHVFDTIYREGSLTRAARALHLTQPAVSGAVAKLRTSGSNARTGSSICIWSIQSPMLHSIRT